jgi:hypothetical protein
MSKRNENFLALAITGVILGVIFLLPANWPETARMALLISIPLLLLVFVTYILPPIRLHKNHWLSAHAEYEPINPARDVIPEEVWARIREAIGSLNACGFEVLGHFRKTEKDAVSFVTFLQNADHLTVGHLITVFGINQKGLAEKGALGFHSESADGTEFITGNANILAGVPRRKDRVGIWMPEIQDPSDLYELHQRLVKAFCPRPKEYNVDGKPGQYMNKYSANEIAHWAEKGYYKLDAKADVFRLTWKGAVLIAWKMLWPLKPIRRAWRKHQTNKILRKLEE